jgi:hypothetical protein
VVEIGDIDAATFPTAQMGAGPMAPTRETDQECEIAVENKHRVQLPLDTLDSELGALLLHPTLLRSMVSA